MADFSVGDLEKAIKDILKGADLNSLSTKKVRKMLEEKFDTDFTSRKKEIDKLVMKLITENEEEEEKSGEKSEEQEAENGVNGGSDVDAQSEEGEEVPKEKEKTTKPQKGGKRKSAGKADDSEDPVMSSIKQMDDEDLAKRLQEEESGLRTRGARRAAAAPPKPKKQRKEQDPDKKKKTTAYNRPYRLSDGLAALVGTEEMPRAEVVKTLWSVVKERNLQDPKNKQFIICDEELHKVFGVKRFRAFGMMKYLEKHFISKD